MLKYMIHIRSSYVLLAWLQTLPEQFSTQTKLDLNANTSMHFNINIFTIVTGYCVQ